MTIFSYEDFPGDGVNRDFAVNNPYINRAHVTLVVNGVPVTFVWVNASLVRADVAPADGSVVRVTRTTPLDAPLVDYEDGSALAESELDLQTLQMLYVAQETFDNTSNLTVGQAQTAAAEASTSAAAALSSEVAAAASEVAAAASEAAADADATATAAAAVSTAADAVATAADALQTAADSAGATVSASNAATSASEASSSEIAADASAVAAAASAAALQATSLTSLAIGTGATTFITQTGKQFAAGQWVLATSDADPTNYMHGQITSYISSDLNVNVTNIGGAGTLADWTLTVAGTQGGIGLTGPAGDAITALRTVVGTADTLVITDAGKYVRCTSALATAVTVPPNSAVAFSVGQQITIAQAGAGQVTVTAGVGVTINTPETLLTRKQFSAVTVIKVATDEWDLVGDVSTA